MILIEPHYLPSLEFLCAVLPAEHVVLEGNGNYEKQSYRNRCYINTSQGTSMMVVPLTGRHGKVLYKDVRVEPGMKWRKNHWRTISSAYAKAPFFEHYADELQGVILSGSSFLFDLNVAGLSFCLRNLGLKKEISLTTNFEKESPSGIYDLRDRVDCKNDISASPFYRPKPYVQVFGSAFASNLSVIDLLFCEGPRGIQTLRESGIAN